MPANPEPEDFHAGSKSSVDSCYQYTSKKNKAIFFAHTGSEIKSDQINPATKKPLYNLD